MAVKLCSAAVLVSLLLVRSGVTDEVTPPCQLADLFLRSPVDTDGNARLIDVFPLTGHLTAFEAWMDYTMAGFDIEAAAGPADKCLAEVLTPGTTTVDPGSFVMAEVEVKSAPGKGFYDEFFTVNVSRHLGSETALRALRIHGAVLQPRWSPEVRNYTAVLDVAEDFVRFEFIRLDEGQVINLVGELEAAINANPPTEQEEPAMTTNIRGSAQEEAALEKAVLGAAGRSIWEVPIGEVQHQPERLLTTLDVGYARRVFLEVQSADQAARASYRFDVVRPTCPADRRFFDPDAGLCTDVCNEGFFGNAATGRCTACLIPHCASCDVARGGHGEACTLCANGYALTEGGLCGSPGPQTGIEQVAEQEALAAVGYWRRHWVLFGSCALSAVVACAGCLTLVCCSTTRRRPRLLDMDDDDDISSVGYYEESYRG